MNYLRFLSNTGEGILNYQITINVINTIEYGSIKMKAPQPGVYPEGLEKKVKLPDKAEVLLRPIKHSDVELWVELYNSLSSMTKYYRFFTSHREPNQKMINQYVKIDYINNFAIVAIIKGNGKEKMIGVARYILDPPPDSAELAVVVADEWQGRGLGTQLLLSILNIMIRRKVKKLHGDIFLENRKMLKLMHDSGFKLTDKEDSYGVRHFELPL